VLLDAVAVVFAAEGTDQTVGVIGEQHGVRDVVFLDRLGEKFTSY